MALPIPAISSVVPAQIGSFSANPPSIDTLLTGTVTVSIEGVRQNNFVLVCGPNLTAGLYVLGPAQILNNTDTNNVSFTIYNSTGGTLNDGAQTFIYMVL